MSEYIKEENPKTLLKERKELFVDAIKHDKKPKRIPMMSHAWTWKAMDAGYNLEEYIYDYDKRIDALRKHYEKYKMDCLIDLGNRNAFPVSDCFGPNPVYKISEDKLHMNVIDNVTMDFDDYDTVIKDGYLKFKFERVLADRYGFKTKEEVKDCFVRAGKEYVKMQKYVKDISDIYINEYASPALNKEKGPNPMDQIIGNGMRGIVGTALDIRRHPDKVKEMCDYLYESQWKGFKKRLAEYDYYADDTNCTALRTTSLSHTFLGIKQAERYLWPYWKSSCDYIASNGFLGILYLEGTIQHIIPLLQDIKDGTMAILIEKEDPVKLQKQLPNVSIIGGYPSRLLGYSDKGSCIKEAKRLIDEAGADGNWIFSTDIMLSYPEDCKGENLKAVCDTIREYGVYKG